MKTDLVSGRCTSVQLVRAYLSRIEVWNPQLRAVIVTNPDALTAAAASDVARRSGTPQGKLAGIPILIKDVIETSDRMPTTAGSLALTENMNSRDAFLVARLRNAGAIVLGKTNLSEWSNTRSSQTISGWSAVGGQTRNPYGLDRSACGSSSGSGSATAAEFAAASIGVENDGSIACPAAMNGVVGLKPTVGLISRTYIVPGSLAQDTAGPMARNVADVALLLTAMSGSDPADAATSLADEHKQDYVLSLKTDSLKGVRIGVMRYAAGFHLGTDHLFDQALAILKSQGATLVDVEAFPNLDKLDHLEGIVFSDEMKTQLQAYLSSLPPGHVSTRSLADLIEFNRTHPAEQVSRIGQDKFEGTSKPKRTHIALLDPRVSMRCYVPTT